MKIIGGTVSTPMPRANLNQTDPKKADYVYGRDNYIRREKLQDATDAALEQAKESGEFDGPQGPAGADGKSAYAYAQDGGYTGTEEEFAKKLAAESPGIHIGTEAPTDENVAIWIDPDEEPETGGGIDVTAEVGQTIIVKAVDENGKPTEWEAADYQPRTHYSKYTENDVIFPETVVEWNEDTGYIGILSLSAPLEAGKTYKVTYNGVEYLTTGREYEGVGIHIGNLTFMGGDYVYLDDTGEPFAILYISDAAMLLTGPVSEELSAGSALVRIAGGTEFVKAIPNKYLTNASVFYLEIPLGSSVTSQKELQVQEALANGRQIILVTHGLKTYHMPLLTMVDGVLYFWRVGVNTHITEYTLTPNGVGYDVAIKSYSYSTLEG